MFKASSSSSVALRSASGHLRTFATAVDPPVRRYGGLKDQDRIFTNAYCRHDHGLKGAKVLDTLKVRCSYSYVFTLSPVVIGTAQKTSCSRATLGSSNKSKIPACEEEEEQGFLAV